MYPGLQPRTLTSVLLVFQVYGDIAPSTVHNAADAGANMIVSGSAISADNPGDLIPLFRSSGDAVVEKRIACS